MGIYGQVSSGKVALIIIILLYSVSAYLPSLLRCHRGCFSPQSRSPPAALH